MDFHARLDPHFTRDKRGHLKFKKFISKTFGSRQWQLFVVLDGKAVIGYSLCKISNPPLVLAISRYGMMLDAYIKLELNVATTNKFACSFWRKKGFREYLKVMSQPV